MAKKTLDAAFRAHTTFGPGLLQSAYTACLVHEIRKSGLEVKTEVPVTIAYEGVKLPDVGYCIDILVANELVIEVKSMENIAPVHLSQLISYLKLSNRRLGVPINFNVESLRDGIYRRVYRF
jgi:GxxExxY protein